MDRVNQLRGGETGSAASSPLSSSEASLAYVSATGDDTKYFSLSEADSTLDVTPLEEDLANPCDSALPPSLHEPGNDLDGFKIGQTIEAAKILSGGVNIFEDNDNSFDGNELVIDDNVGIDVDKKLEDVEENCVLPVPESTLVDNETDIPSKETEVQLQINGKSVDAIDIGNGLYLYRRDGEEELAAVQVFTEGEEPSFKFLKVRENAERNLEVYEEIEVEVTKSVPSKATKALKNTSTPAKNISKPAGVSNERKVNPDNPISNENENITLGESIHNLPEMPVDSVGTNPATEPLQTKLSPIRSGFLPMAYHSTPNKDGIPLTKTMVDQQLHPSRHSDNVKKTIEVNTENCKQKLHEKGKVSTPSEDNKESPLEQELKINTPSEPLSAIESSSNDISSISNEENIIKDDDNKDISSKRNIQPSSQSAIHALSVDLIQESKKIETKEVNCVFKEKYHLASDSELAATNIGTPGLITVENTKTTEKETSVTNTKTSLDNQDQTNVIDVFMGQSNVATNQVEHTEVQQKESIYTHLNSSQNTSITSNTLTAEEEIISLNTTKQSVNQIDTNTPKISDVIPEQTNLVTSQAKLAKNNQIHDAVVHSEPLQSSEQAKQITSKEKNNLEMHGVSKIVHENIISNIPSSKEPKNNKVTEQLTSTDNKLTQRDKSENATSNFDSIPVQEPLTNTRNNNTNKNDDSSKLIISKVNETREKLNEISLIKNDSNKRSEELIQLTDLGVEVPKNALPDILEKGFPDCLKSVADILKPKSYDSKRDLTLSHLNVKKESKIDQTYNSLQSKIIAKPSSACVSKLDEQKRIPANVLPITKVESLSSMHDKPKSLLPILSNKSDDSLISKYVNRAVIIKNNIAPVNVQMAPLLKKNETVVKDIQVSTTSDIKPKLLNNNSAVPFGKWTEANKQAYLNKINEPKVIFNPNQIKQAKDLNRRDILKKMDSQRQSFANYSRSLEVLRKANVKKEQTEYAVKVIPKQETNTSPKVEHSNEKCAVPLVSPKAVKTQADDETIDSSLIVETPKKRQDFNNQELIDKTIEDLMDKNLNTNLLTKPKTHNVDEVEKKMNDLHGIPFVERPVHELPLRYNRDLITYSKPGKRSTNLQSIKETTIPKVAPLSKPLDTVVTKTINLEEDSEDEVLEHEPVTGDMQFTKSNLGIEKVSKKEVLISPSSSNDRKPLAITEKEINKYAQSSSIPFKDCKPSQTVNNTIPHEDKRLGQYITQASKSQTYLHSSTVKTIKNPSFQPICTEESNNKTSPSKVQMAYTSAMTAKRYIKSSPITVLEDRPVKVMFMDQGTSFISSPVNIQGNELSPIKKYTKTEEYPLKSYDSDRNASSSNTNQDEQKNYQIKHQRKQVLTPVDEPALEMVAASKAKSVDRKVTDKLKRANDENCTDKSIIPKKTYLLGRSAVCEDLSKEIPVGGTCKNLVPISNAASAIDNLVKAAEMLENQQKIAESVESSNDSLQPVKRGRGRPRKYPPNSSDADKPSTPSPQKKPRVTRAIRISTSDEDLETSSDDEIVMVNWTMGKINENIVCPICGKLFRSENVVFKHVKHCTGPSPNRSETSERRTSKRGRKRSDESDISSMDTLDEKSSIKLSIHSNKDRKQSVEREKPKQETSDIIVIEDTPIKSKQKDEQIIEKKAVIQEQIVSKPVNKTEVTTKYGNIECEKCKKVFRQMSYYVKHKKEECKSQPKKDPVKTKNSQNTFQSVFSCEVCKKDFRKLHHLVQHRMIHDPTTSKRRKSSVELQDKTKDIKSTDDQSAGFRCEACDKSFRKLHHLVEHRETHDGQIKNKPLAAQSPANKDKAETAPQCNICNKTFRKLHHMIEHKEQHANPKPDKTEEKNSKAAVPTTDIIHECPLCYMVFPNEHSLNKHVGNCQKKKRQSLSKSGQTVIDNESASVNENIFETVSTKPLELHDSVTAPIMNQTDIMEKNLGDTNIDRTKDSLKKMTVSTDVTKAPTSDKNDSNFIKLPIENKPNQSVPLDSIPLRRQSKETKNITTEAVKNKKTEIVEAVEMKNTPNKKMAAKHNIPVTITRRQKSITAPVVENNETSDDEDIRYMLNPNFEVEQAEAAELFMDKAAHKRNSLHIDRPASKFDEALKRRTSLQIHSKLTKRTLAEVKQKQNSRDKLFKFPKLSSKSIEMNTSDSDDSDTKYAFPEVAAKTEPQIEEPTKKIIKRKSLNEKRKSLTGLAKKKAVSEVRLKPSAIAPPPLKAAIKRRTLHLIEHKCDCGQMFNSATLLSHHVSLSHTPPRRSRRRSLTPSPSPKPTPNRGKQTPAKDTTPKAKKNPEPRKQDIKSTVTRKSSVTEATASKRLKKTDDPISSVDTTTRKRRKQGFHSGVPVPAKMKKLFNKQKLL